MHSVLSILVCYRLEAYERNENFGNALDNEPGPVFRMDLPDPKAYKDVNTDMQVIPHLTVDRSPQPHFIFPLPWMTFTG